MVTPVFFNRHPFYAQTIIICAIGLFCVAEVSLPPPPQTPRACGISSPAPKTSALPNSGCVTGRTTARMASMRAWRSAVSEESVVKGHTRWMEHDGSASSCTRARDKWTGTHRHTHKNPNETTNEAADNCDGLSGHGVERILHHWAVVVFNRQRGLNWILK